MKARKVTTIAAVLGFALFTLQESAMAQSNCQQAKGQQAGVFDGVTNTTTGEITRGGWLNGTTLDVFHGAVLPTADPTTVSFTGDFTLTTIHGQLKANNVYIFDFVTGVAAVFGRINPTTSTGAFAGATGVLYWAGKTIRSARHTTSTSTESRRRFADTKTRAARALFVTHPSGRPVRKVPHSPSSRMPELVNCAQPGDDAVPTRWH